MVFSTNQARQFYVMKGNMQYNADPSNAGAQPTSNNNVQVVDVNKKAPYLVVKGAAGNTRTDLLTNIESVKVTDAGALATPLKKASVSLNSNVIAGQDYILRIVVSQFAGMSDEEKYFKFGCVHGKANMTKSEFYITLIESLKKNFSRELTKLFEFKGIKKSDHSLVDNPSIDTYTEASDATTLEGIAICEIEQEWTLGIKAQVPVLFKAECDNIIVSGDEEVWGTVTESTWGTPVGNGKKIADLEYFCMGERADIYRNVNWPHSIHTDYLTDPTTAYAVLDVHYSTVEGGVDVQKSEKDLTVVTATANKAELVKVAKKLAAAAGFSTYTSVASTGAVTEENVA